MKIYNLYVPLVKRLKIALMLIVFLSATINRSNFPNEGTKIIQQNI